MRKLGTYLQLLLVLVLAPATIVCCTQRMDERIIEGNTANIEMTLSNQSQSKSIVTLQDDRTINTLTIAIFNDKGKRVDFKSFDYNNSPIRLTTVSGSNSRIVTIANANHSLTQRLKKATSYTQMAELVIDASDSLSKKGNLLMVDDMMVDIKSGNNTFTLPLQFICSKVSVKIENQLQGGESFTINSCKLVNMPTSSYMLKRDSDVENGYADRYVAWSEDKQTTSVDFFMLENRRGIRTEQPHEKEGQQHLNKRQYAPKGASHMVISATHRTPRGTASFEMFLYLGQNSSTDYNVKRSEHHKYTIRVKGFNNISVDSNIEYEDNNFDIVYGDDLRMDAHPDTRQLLIKNGTGKASIEILDNNGRPFNDPNFNAQWLKISPMDLMRPQIRQQGNGKNTRWQQQGDKGTFVRGKYIPHKSARAQLAGGWNEVDIDNDDMMSLAQATYRMCYIITDIQVDNSTPNALYIHTDDNTSGVERRAQVALSFVGQDGKKTKQLITIFQLGAVYVGTFNGRKLYIETNEESAINIYPDGLPSLSTHHTMQWGYNSSSLYKESDNFIDGAFLTASAVYGSKQDSWVKNDARFVQKNSDGTPKFGELEYRTKYGSGIGGHGLISEPYNENTSEAPYYNPTSKNGATTFNPIYNSSAARYCHEKNRDKNGDGVIDDSESEWFLPSFNELEHLWVAQNGIKPEARMSLDQKYWSSTEYSNNKAFAISMHNGVDYEMLHKTTTARVRCVRLGERAVGEVVQVDGKGNIVINNDDLPAGAVTSISKGMAPTSASMNETIYKKLAIAKSDIPNIYWAEAMGYSDTYNSTIANNIAPNQATGCRAYHEATNGSDKGQWRVPTLRELVRIYILSKDLAAKSSQFTPLSSTSYWSSSEDEAWHAWSVNMSPQSAPDYDMAPEASKRYSMFVNVRCVREVATATP